MLEFFDVRDQANKGKVRNEAYSIEESGAHSIKVTVPFIPWEHYEASTLYQAGLSFRDYMSVINDGLRGNKDYFNLRAKLCRDTKQGDPPGWKIPGGLANSESRTGFLECTPSGRTLIVRDNSFGGMNLVSTRWCDWIHFSPERAVSNLVLPSGTFPCVGSITGAWAFEDAVDVQWHAKFLVVHTTIQDESNHAFNFVLSESALQPDKANMCM